MSITSLIVLLGLGLAVSAHAQPARNAKAIVTVIDVTGSFLPGATVTVTPLELAGAGGITVSISAQNLTNRSNYSGFSGVMTSPYFMQATGVQNPRQIDLSLRFNF